MSKKTKVILQFCACGEHARIILRDGSPTCRFGSQADGRYVARQLQECGYLTEEEEAYIEDCIALSSLPATTSNLPEIELLAIAIPASDILEIAQILSQGSASTGDTSDEDDMSFPG